MYESKVNIDNQYSMYHFINTVNVPRLSEEDKNKLDQNLTKEESKERKSKINECKKKER